MNQKKFHKTNRPVIKSLARRLCTVFLALLLGVGGVIPTAFAATDGPYIYFSANPMTEDGDIVILVNLAELSGKLPKYNALCSVNFSFTYDDTQFALKEADPIMQVNEYTIAKRAKAIETKVNGSTISVSFLDSTLSNSLITQGGTLCYFTLEALHPVSLWNSDDTYPVRFVPGSIGGVLYHTLTYETQIYKQLSGLDLMLGGYNTPFRIECPPVGKKISVTSGSNRMMVDDSAIDMDATPYFEGEQLMIPIRYLAQSAGMEVNWDGLSETARLCGVLRTCYIPLRQGGIFVNGIMYPLDVSPVCKDGRTYLPVSAIPLLFGNGADVTVQDGTAEIIIH